MQKYAKSLFPPYIYRRFFIFLTIKLENRDGYAVFYLNGNRCCLHLAFGYLDLHHAGLTVQWLLLVEDEIADAIVDGFSTIVLDGLQRVGVVTDQGVGTSVDQSVGLQSLTGNGLQRVLATPVERHDDHGLRVGLFELPDV